MKAFLFPLICSAALLTACSDRITTSTEMVFDESGAFSPPAGGTTFSFVQEEIFDRSCALSGCHGDQVFPNLSRGKAYAGIVGIASSQGLELIAPGLPDSSYLYIKVTAGPGMKGSRMPLGSSLSSASIDALREWIERGAPDD